MPYKQSVVFFLTIYITKSNKIEKTGLNLKYKFKNTQGDIEMNLKMKLTICVSGLFL